MSGAAAGGAAAGGEQSHRNAALVAENVQLQKEIARMRHALGVKDADNARLRAEVKMQAETPASSGSKEKSSRAGDIVGGVLGVLVVVVLSGLALYRWRKTKRSNRVFGATLWVADDGSNEGIQLVPLSPGTREFGEVAARFRETLPQATLVRIDRVQNRPLYDSFILQVETLKRQMGANWDEGRMRRMLFHGTKAVEAIVNSVDGHGFFPMLAGT